MFLPPLDPCEAPVARFRSAFGFATLGLAAIAACEYDARVSPGPAAARAPELAAMAARRTGGAATGRHLVTVPGQAPSDFSAPVEAKGGKVLWVSRGKR